MSERDALLAAVLAAPADDLPRLLFADWCDDHGDPDRAEFVRVQVELARLPADHPARPPLERRERELLTTDRRAGWGVPGFSGRQEFRRGFVEGVRTVAEWFVGFGDRLFELAPVRAVRLSVLGSHIPAICRVAGLAKVHTLDLSGNWLGSGDRLERLLTDAPLAGLRELVLRDNRLFADSVALVAQSPVARHLTALNLSGNPLAEDGMAALAATYRFRGLRSLTVRNDEQSFEDSVHGSGAAALAAATGLPKLKRLDLSGHHVGDAGLIALIDSPLGQRLDVLRLAQNNLGEIGDEWAQRLTRADRVPRLIDLSGRRNSVGRLAASSLADWPRLADGVTVDLRGCTMTPPAYLALAASPFAGRLLLDPHPPAEEPS